MNRKMLHVLIALVLVACALSPFVESALNSQDSMFSTGCDGESTLAIVVLLLELVLSLASLLAFLWPTAQLQERVEIESASPISALAFFIDAPDFLSSVPLRI